MTQASTDYILRTKDIVKRYKGVVALDRVSIHIRRGTIHGLLGENGAGKSTLVSLISGHIAPTEGQILLGGEEIQGSDVKEMEARGVFLVTQEPMIVESMSVADNLMLGLWPVKRGFLGVVDQRALLADAARVLADTGLDPATLAGRLSAVEKRKLNILRALFSGGKLLILDEPTAALTLADRDHLFDFMRELKATGVTFVFISHYNEEILGICDGVSVLRNGQLAGEMDTLASIDSDALSELVTGRDVPLFHRQNPGKKTGSGWRIEKLLAPGIEIDQFEIAPGEIVGFAGLPGSGAKEFAKVLFGLNRASAGSFSHAGNPIALPDHPQTAFATGIAYLSDDRRRDGFVGLQSIGHNISMSSLGELSVAGIVDKTREQRVVDHYFDVLRIKAPTPEIAVGTLSGGNAQKVVLSRLLATGPQLLILDEPTRGIDVGVKEEIHQLVDSLTSEGVSVIVMTSDLDELVRLVDRVCVFVGGRVHNEYVGAEIDKDVILEDAFGSATLQSHIEDVNMQSQKTSPADMAAASSGATASAAARRSPRQSTSQWLFQNVVWIWLVALIILFGVVNPFFLTVSNFQNVILQSTVLGLLALAVSLPLLVGEIDLSIAANMGFSAAVGALLSTQYGMPAVVGVPVGILVATAIGFINGLCVTRLRMVSLIETLAMMIILQGALLATTKGNTISDMSESYVWIGQYAIDGWPVMPIVFVIALIGMAFLLRRTVLGRKLYATGGNQLAANSAGIRVNRVKIISFTISGLLSGIAGYLLAAWQMAITSGQGDGFQLYAIAAPIIGGVSVFGGRGGIAGILGGVLLLTVIQVGLAITEVPSFYVQMIGGILIFVAVAVDAVRVKFMSR